MENAVRPLDDVSAGSLGLSWSWERNTPSGQPRSSFHFSFPSRPKRRDLLWEGPSGGLVSGRCGHWLVVSDQWSAEVGESRNAAVNRIRFRGPVHCPLGGGAWKWGRDSPWNCFQSFASSWKVVGRRKNTRRILQVLGDPKMTSLARARCPFSPSPTTSCNALQRR